MAIDYYSYQHISADRTRIIEHPVSRSIHSFTISRVYGSGRQYVYIYCDLFLNYLLLITITCLFISRRFNCIWASIASDDTRYFRIHFFYFRICHWTAYGGRKVASQIIVDFIVLKTENRQAGHAGGDAVVFDKAQSFWKALLYAIITNTSYWMEECFRGSYEVGEMPGMTR